MEATKADERFMSMLTEAGVDLERPDILATWRVFKAIAHVPLTDTCGGLLFEYGLSGSGFHVHFVRYFYIGDDPFMIDCNFEYGANPALSGYKTDVEVFLGERLEDQTFFRDAEADAAFWQAVGQHKAIEATIYVCEQ